MAESNPTTNNHLLDALDGLYEAASKLRFLRSVQPMEGVILEERPLEGLHVILAEIEENLQTACAQIQEERDDQAIAEMEQAREK